MDSVSHCQCETCAPNLGVGLLSLTKEEKERLDKRIELAKLEKKIIDQKRLMGTGREEPLLLAIYRDAARSIRK
jgi:hypothetical protein